MITFGEVRNSGRPVKVLYHKNCNDGLMSAGLLWSMFGDLATYTAVQYGESRPNIEPNDIVLIVDFSYPRCELDELAKGGVGLVVLDHHASAEKELLGAPYAFFDMKRSGCQLTHDWVLGILDPQENWQREILEAGRPRIVDVIADRDLWTWKLPETKDVTAGVLLIDQTPRAWANLLSSEGASEQLASWGRTILAYQKKIIDRSVEKVIRRGKQGWVNTPVLQSEIGHEILEKNPNIDMAVIWYHDPSREDGRCFQYSLRSRKGGVDCSEVAKAYGGGGHQAAAGCSTADLLHML